MKNPKMSQTKKLVSLALAIDRELELLYKELSEIERVLNNRPAKGWIEWKYIKCGKDRCSCATGKGHGPYAYLRYWENGHLKSIYLGKTSSRSIDDKERQGLEDRKRKIQESIEELNKALVEAEKILMGAL